MSEGLNRVTLVGNLGQEPDLRETSAGAVLKLRLATNERFKGSDGEWQDRTEWHTVSIWGKRANGLATFLRKGARVLVEGAIRTRSYEKDGETKYATEISARNILPLDGKAVVSTVAGPIGVAHGVGSEFASPTFGSGDDDCPF